MISLISYLGESWRERRWAVLKKKKMWKQRGSKDQLQRCCPWRSVCKDDSVGESCLPSFMLCTLLFSWIWQVLWLVLDQWNMTEETLCGFWSLCLIILHFLPGCLRTLPTGFSLRTHLSHCEKSKHMEMAHRCSCRQLQLSPQPASTVNLVNELSWTFSPTETSDTTNPSCCLTATGWDGLSEYCPTEPY